MSDIETTSVSARRKATGAKFSLYFVPLEFSDDQCIYTNPAVELAIKFAARWICNKVSISKDDEIISRTKTLGIVLIEGQLYARIKDAAPRLSEAEILDLVRDCHELIVAFLRGMDDLQDRIGVEPHIYALPSREFGRLSPLSVEIEPNVLAEFRAVQII